MDDAAIVASYSDTALNGILRQLRISKNWPQRLRAAELEKLCRGILSPTPTKQSKS